MMTNPTITMLMSWKTEQEARNFIKTLKHREKYTVLSVLNQENNEQLFTVILQKAAEIIFENDATND